MDIASILKLIIWLAVLGGTVLLGMKFTSKAAGNVNAAL